MDLDEEYKRLQETINALFDSSGHSQCGRFYPRQWTLEEIAALKDNGNSSDVESALALLANEIIKLKSE